MALENLDRTQWSFAEALAHVGTVVAAHRAVEASRLPAAPPREPMPWERPVDPREKWKAEAHEQFMVALRDGDLHAQGRYTEERPHAWGGAGTGFGLHSGYHTGIRPEQWREARYLNGKLTAVHWELWFASMAYVLVTALRRIGLAGTELAAATCGSIRLKLLKIGALVTHSVRRVRVAMASSCPDAAVFRLAHARLCG